MMIRATSSKSTDRQTDRQSRPNHSESRRDSPRTYDSERAAWVDFGVRGPGTTKYTYFTWFYVLPRLCPHSENTVKYDVLALRSAPKHVKYDVF